VQIGIVSQWYSPEPAFIPASLAADLAARGHRVRVLTGYPNYPEGRIYPGYRQRWNGLETAGPVTVRRVPVYPSHDSSALRRAASYLSFAATSTLAAARFLAGADVLYVYHPPATTFAAAALLRLLYRTPAVLHVADVWPESVTASPLAPTGAAGAVLDRALRRTMRALYRSAAGVAVSAPSMRDLVIERGADPSTVHAVLNWTDEALFRPVPPSWAALREIGYRGRCTVMHAGNIGPFQNIAGAVRAAAAVEHSRLVDLVLVGSGIEEEPARALAARLGAGNVRFLGRRAPEAMAPLYAAADYQLVTLRDLPIFRGTIPSKLQAAFCCGSPVVASVAGDAGRLVERAGAGLSCPPEDWRALADGFLAAAAASPADRADMARRARRAYQEHMSRRAGVDRIERMLAEAAARGVRR
jgi:glycosyltransferase involved in cell wall biosynthesis